MHQPNIPEEESGSTWRRWDSLPANPEGALQDPGRWHAKRLGEREACAALLTTFLSGKQLYLGLPEPYQFVQMPETLRPGLWREVCPCSEHQGRAGSHPLNPSEVTLTLEYGPTCVWIFITIPARYRANYAWLPSIAMEQGIDEELCGVLVAKPV